MCSLNTIITKHEARIVPAAIEEYIQPRVPLHCSFFLSLLDSMSLWTLHVVPCKILLCHLITLEGNRPSLGGTDNWERLATFLSMLVELDKREEDSMCKNLTLPKKHWKIAWFLVFLGRECTVYRTIMERPKSLCDCHLEEAMFVVRNGDSYGALWYSSFLSCL